MPRFVRYVANTDTGDKTLSAFGYSQQANTRKLDRQRANIGVRDKTNKNEIKSLQTYEEYLKIIYFKEEKKSSKYLTLDLRDVKHIKHAEHISVCYEILFSNYFYLFINSIMTV